MEKLNTTNDEKIRKIVETLKNEKLIDKPLDFLFRNTTQDYPKATHNVLRLPGIFKKIEDTGVYVRGKGALQMDYAESAIIAENKEVAYDVEHQSHRLPTSKIQIIHHYCYSTGFKLKKPVYPFVVTNENYPPYKIFNVDGFKFIIYFIIFSEEKIYKILNTLMEKDYTNEEFSDEDYVSLVFCILFAKKPYAKDVVEKVVNMSIPSESISFQHQLDLNFAQTMMIKYHFQDDDEKIEELLTMITKTVPESKLDELLHRHHSQIDIDELRTVNEQLKTELKNKNTELKNKNKEIKHLNELLVTHGIIIK